MALLTTEHTEINNNNSVYSVVKKSNGRIAGLCSTEDEAIDKQVLYKAGSPSFPGPLAHNNTIDLGICKIFYHYIQVGGFGNPAILQAYFNGPSGNKPCR